MKTKSILVLAIVAILSGLVDTAEEVMKKTGTRVKYLVSTMIEIPRAALIADQIAEVAEFFSFRTNDLTQMTFGFSRDDAGEFLPDYLAKKILPAEPFQTLDEEGVGQLVDVGIKRGRASRPDLKVEYAMNTVVTRTVLISAIGSG